MLTRRAGPQAPKGAGRTSAADGKNRSCEAWLAALRMRLRRLAEECVGRGVGDAHANGTRAPVACVTALDGVPGVQLVLTKPHGAQVRKT